MKFHQKSPQFFISLIFNEISVNFSEISLTIFSRVAAREDSGYSFPKSVSVHSLWSGRVLIGAWALKGMNMVTTENSIML